jgi:catechol 2,3-dioxygenase-like lactoylglutathione lyase family enzyme
MDTVTTNAAATDMGAAAVLHPRGPLAPAAIAPDLFAHFVLRTANLPSMRDWYATILNARVVFQNDLICFLTYDDEHHRLALINVPGLVAPAPDAWGLAHVAYTYRCVHDLLATYVRLRDAGIRPVRPINHGPTLSFYYKDPDGSAVELQVDAFPSKAEAAGFFDTQAFRDNPIGVLVDPEDLVRAWEAGVPEADLLRRPAGQPEQAMGARR